MESVHTSFELSCDDKLKKVTLKAAGWDTLDQEFHVTNTPLIYSQFITGSITV